MHQAYTIAAGASFKAHGITTTQENPAAFAAANHPHHAHPELADASFNSRFEPAIPAAYAATSNTNFIPPR